MNSTHADIPAAGIPAAERAAERFAEVSMRAVR
jgi:hypothetical protein